MLGSQVMEVALLDESKRNSTSATEDQQKAFVSPPAPNSARTFDAI